MTTTKYFSISAGILTALLVLYVGNLTLNSTPKSSAKGEYQYKVVDLGCGMLAVMEETGRQCVETALNKEAAGGWKLISTDSQSLASSIVAFEKEQ